MRSNHARRAAMAGAAALLLIAPVVCLTHADPAPPAAAADALPEDLVAAIQRDLGLTPDQYLDRAEAGQRLVTFADSIHQQFPASYAGAWLDPAGTPLIGLADGPDKAAARTAVEAAGFQVKDQQHSENTLLDQFAQLNDWIQKLPAALADHIKHASIDTVNNDIALHVDDTAETQGLQLPDFLGFVRTVLGSLGSAQPPTTTPPTTTPPTTTPPTTTAKPPTTTTPKPTTTTKPPTTTTPKPTTTTKPPTTTTQAPPADDAFLGGDAYLNGRITTCSLGFNATDGSGHAVNITAGHCDPIRESAGTADAAEAYARYGDVIGDRFGTFDKTDVNGLDYSLIKIDDNVASRFENNFVRVPGGNPVAITGTADPVVGAPVCKSGERSGYTCGKISNINQWTSDGGSKAIVNKAFLSNLCGLRGDSGGPVLTGTKALGILSMGNMSSQAECDRAAGNSPDSDGPIMVIYATPIKQILAANPGLKVRTN